MYRFKRSFFILLFIFSALTGLASDNIRDSIAHYKTKIQLAKAIDNRQLVLNTYFGNQFTNLSPWTANNDDFDKVIAFLKEGIDYARSISDFDYAMIGYTYQSAILRQKKDYEKALELAIKPLSELEYIRSDSVKALVYLELGNCYRDKNYSTQADKYYSQAYSIALSIRSRVLEVGVNMALAELYRKKADTVEVKKYWYRNIAIHRKAHDGNGLLTDYTQLGRVTDNTAYIDTVYAISDSLQLKERPLAAMNILIAIYGYVKKDVGKVLHYLDSVPSLKNSYIEGNSGIANYYYYLGQLYLGNNMPDSALRYFRLTEPGFLRDSLLFKLESFTKNFAICYEKLKDWPNAIRYYQRSLDYSQELNDLENLVRITNALSSLYDSVSNYKLAYVYKLLNSDSKDSLAKMTNEKNLAWGEIDRERKKHDEELRQEEELLRKKHNLQYLAIIIVICAIFLSLTVLGMFPVSKLVIRMTGFIAFICLFEFIILLIEHSVLHPLTHGDPLKTWSIKIVLIALLVRAQEFLEHRYTHFLQSRKLHHARKGLLAKKWWKKKPKNPVLQTQGSEETTAKP